MQVSDRASHEKRLAHEHASRLAPQVYQNWTSCRHTTRHIVGSNSIFVLWQQFLDEPMVVGSFVISDIRASFTEGLNLKVLFTNDLILNAPCWVTHTPTDILGNGRVFAHVPYIPEITFLEKVEQGQDTLRLPLVLRTEGNPNDPKEGELQVTPVGLFRKAHPQFKELRL